MDEGNILDCLCYNNLMEFINKYVPIKYMLLNVLNSEIYGIG